MDTQLSIFYLRISILKVIKGLLLNVNRVVQVTIKGARLNASLKLLPNKKLPLV